jgi:hypothetical protein
MGMNRNWQNLKLFGIGCLQGIGICALLALYIMLNHFLFETGCFFRVSYESVLVTTIAYLMGFRYINKHS